MRRLYLILFSVFLIAYSAGIIIARAVKHQSHETPDIVLQEPCSAPLDTELGGNLLRPLHWSTTVMF